MFFETVGNRQLVKRAQFLQEGLHSRVCLNRESNVRKYEDSYTPHLLAVSNGHKTARLIGNVNNDHCRIVATGTLPIVSCEDELGTI